MMTEKRTNTDRHRDLRERKRAAGLQRRTVWLSEESLQHLAELKQVYLTQDEAIRYALWRSVRT